MTQQCKSQHELSDLWEGINEVFLTNKQTNNKRPTIIAQESLSFLWFHRNEASNEIVEDGCDKDDE